MKNRGQIKWDISREALRTHTSVHSQGRSVRKYSSRRKGKGTTESFWNKREGQAGGARQTLVHAHTVGVSFIPATPQHPPRTMLYAEQALSKCVSTEWKLRNGSSHARMIRKSQQRIWGGRKRALAVLYGKSGAKNPKQANETCGKTKDEVF